MRFLVSSPKSGLPGKHIVTCNCVPWPSISGCETQERAQQLADRLNAAYQAWLSEPGAAAPRKAA